MQLSLATSNFKRVYSGSEAPSYAHELMGALHQVLKLYCAGHGFDEAAASAYFKRLETQAFEKTSEVLNQVDQAAQRMWTSPLKLDNVPLTHQKELCSVINEVIRNDADGELMSSVCVLVRLYMFQRSSMAYTLMQVPNPSSRVLLLHDMIKVCRWSRALLPRALRLTGTLYAQAACAWGGRCVFRQQQQRCVPRL